MSASKGGGRSRTTTRSTTTQTLDPTLSNALWENYARAQALADRPYQPYSGERFADFDPAQHEAFAGMEALGRGAGGQDMLEAAGRARELAGWSPRTATAGDLAGADLTRYENPYTDLVTERALADIERSRRIAATADAAKAQAAGAFGGSRHGVADALAEAEWANQAANAAAQMRMQGYGAAQTAAMADLDRRLNAGLANQAADLSGAQVRLGAAGLMGDHAQRSFDQAVARANLLNQAGGARQAMQQSHLDAAYQDWLAAQQREIAMQQLLNATLGMVPTTMTVDETGLNTSNNSNWKLGASYEHDTSLPFLSRFSPFGG